MVKVLKFPSTELLATKLGSYILEKQAKALSTKDTFNVAISGGSLIKVLNLCLVQDKEVNSKIAWDKLNIYFCDERIVQLDHPDSNFGAFKSIVFDKLSKEIQDKITVYPLNTSLIKDASAAENESIATDYASILPKENGFDLLLLGCGPDGHTCSLFPDEKHRYLLEEVTKTVVWCHDSPKPPPNRITITFPVINNTRDIAFVAEGESKQPIMHEIFDLKKSTLPTTMINDANDKKVSWFVDDAAFEKVQTNEYY
ncbi:hypothetical protein TPHA_0A05240 [Tetrapisispora phaffii CBS 4417]|uniref:6-phosphogluconolactonase-like protein n=1 Tax=Tetrapisispora phaffii (strain ATCC 24235 / CBS 4417 / NBRC 1672 / NRRL Y-8282 / UCD 70-5) TaxID=1071381 RepID=G8BNX1_TETPH|nr:hypothetical protein TPHA_0A05240 [Tetrapisispora phaffii CBS 4417]CCE61599.1 hypothetical protein TPHA_0A05240 [Tetrapisispora phaffii CBS 4417]